MKKKESTRQKSDNADANVPLTEEQRVGISEIMKKLLLALDNMERGGTGTIQ